MNAKEYRLGYMVTLTRNWRTRKVGEGGTAQVFQGLAQTSQNGERIFMAVKRFAKKDQHYLVTRKHSTIIYISKCTHLISFNCLLQNERRYSDMFNHPRLLKLRGFSDNPRGEEYVTLLFDYKENTLKSLIEG